MATPETTCAATFIEDGDTKGGHPYVMNGKERQLSLRAFSEEVKREAYTKQAGVCAGAPCSEKARIFKLDKMEAYHVDPWHSDGRSILTNCKMLCKSCSSRKSGV